MNNNCCPKCFYPPIEGKCSNASCKCHSPAKEPLPDSKVKEAIDFTLKEYGQTFKDLAAIDRGETPKCTCACHANVLKRPYEHDTACCGNMNGFIEENHSGFYAPTDIDVDGLSKIAEAHPNDSIEGIVAAYREKMGEIGMKREWQVGDEWLRTQLGAFERKVRKEMFEEVIEYIGNYTADLCENSQKFKNDLLKRLSN